MMHRTEPNRRSASGLKKRVIGRCLWTRVSLIRNSWMKKDKSTLWDRNSGEPHQPSSPSISALIPSPFSLGDFKRESHSLFRLFYPLSLHAKSKTTFSFSLCLYGFLSHCPNIMWHSALRPFFLRPPPHLSQARRRRLLLPPLLLQPR